METRAPYAIIGLFVVTAIVAVFGFIYWLHNTGGLGDSSVYDVRFDSSVSGLTIGAPVQFNGIRVGEVTDLRLSPEKPEQVTATIAVSSGTPVRQDTQAGLDFLGLTGVPVVTLQGGNAPAVWTNQPGGPRALIAVPLAGQSMTQAARDVLRRLDTVLADNAESLHTTISNLTAFSSALATRCRLTCE